MSKSAIGWVAQIILWSGVVLRWFYPADLHGGYTGILEMAVHCVDIILVMPSWVLLQIIVSPAKAPWAYTVGTVVWVLGLSTLIYILLIKKTTKK